MTEDERVRTAQQERDSGRGAKKDGKLDLERERETGRKR